MALRSHCSPKTSSSAPTNSRSACSGSALTAGPSAAVMTASTTIAASRPALAERQSRAVPAASTMVVASTASTAHARNTAMNSAAAPNQTSLLGIESNSGQIQAMTTVNSSAAAWRSGEHRRASAGAQTGPRPWRIRPGRPSMPVVAVLFGLTKRLLVGRPMQSEHLGHTLLPKKIALPVFASDALSSVAYATEEILIVLSAGGIALFSYTPWIALAVMVLMLVVVASYRQNVHAYPSGGGDYEVASTNLGQRVGLAVASALMVDYTLTVAVSVSAGVANLASAFPGLSSQVTLIAVLVVTAIALINLRGVRESGTAFAIPTYCFIGVVVLMIVWGATRLGLGHHLRAQSAGYHPPAHQYGGLLLLFLLLRAFSSGCTALTGVEAISNGVPAFRKPKSKNAATTLALLGGIAVSMFAGVTALALISHVHVCPSSSQCIRAGG